MVACCKQFEKLRCAVQHELSEPAKLEWIVVHYMREEEKGGAESNGLEIARLRCFAFWRRRLLPFYVTCPWDAYYVRFFRFGRALITFMAR